MKIVGIDPGLKGGVALLETEKAVVSFADAWPTPIGGEGIDIVKVAEDLREIGPDIVVIEQVNAMPGQGVTSMFNFGRGYGALIGICAALKIPLVLVRPTKWKKKVLEGIGTDKDAALIFCQRRYPHVNLRPPRARKLHDGMADALCLATYGLDQEIKEGTDALGKVG